MINLVVSDVDGTLIKPGETKISDEIIEMIKQMKEKGIVFAVASGRDYDSLKPLFGKVRNDIIYITNNGGVIIYQGKVLCKTPIDRSTVFSILSEMEKRKDCRLLVAGERVPYVSTHDTDFLNHLTYRGFTFENVKDLKSVREDFTKISVYRKRGITEELFEYMHDKWGNKVKVVISGERWVDITNEYVNKGNALAVVQRIFHIMEEDTVTFGDNYNDVEMFKHSYFSYAMQHSNSEIRKIAKHIAPNLETIFEDIIRM